MSIIDPYNNICKIVHELKPDVPILISRESVELLERSRCEVYLTCENIVDLVTKLHEKYFGVSKTEKEFLQNDILSNVKTYNGYKITVNAMDIDLKIYDAQIHVTNPIVVDGTLLTIVEVAKLITINGIEFRISSEIELTCRYLKYLMDIPPVEEDHCVVFQARQNKLTTEPKLVSIDDDYVFDKIKNHTKFIIHRPLNKNDSLLRWKDL